MKLFQKQISPWLLYLLIVIGLFFCLTALWRASSTSSLGSSDFFGYWSATHLIAHGENPYDIDSMREVQRNIPTGLEEVIMAWNPPLLFVFLLPLGWLSFSCAKFIWLAVNIGVFLTAALMLAQLYIPATRATARLLFLIFAVFMPQAISSLFMGQVTFLVYFGLVLSLVFLSKERVFWAGAALIFTLIKPHLVVLALVYLFVWMARKRQFIGWVGLVLAGLICMVILFSIRPLWVMDLIGELKISPVNWFTPTVGGLMSYLGVSDAFRSLIFFLLPLPVYLAWFRPNLDAKSVVAFLTLLTVPLTFFGWSYDQVILLIPIAQLFAWVSLSEGKTHKRWFSILLALPVFAYYIHFSLTQNDLYLIWFPFSLWIVYYLAWRLLLRTIPINTL